MSAVCHHFYPYEELDNLLIIFFVTRYKPFANIDIKVIISLILIIAKYIEIAKVM